MKRVTASLLLSLILSTALFSTVVAESTVTSGSDSITVTIITPENITYRSSSIQLTVAAKASFGIADIAYSLDGANLTYVAKWYLAHTFNETFSLNGLSEGSHTLDVSASAFASNVGYITAKSSVTFSINTKTTTPSSEPTTLQTDSPTPSPTSSSSMVSSTPEQTNRTAPTTSDSIFTRNDMVTAVLAIVIVALTIVSISLVYYKRGKGKP